MALVVVFDLKGATCVHLKYYPRNTYKYWTFTVCVFCKIQSQLQRSSYWISGVHLTQLPFCNLSQIWLLWFTCDIYCVTTTFKLILSVQVPNIVFLLSKIYVIHFVMASVFLKFELTLHKSLFCLIVLKTPRIVEEIFGHAIYKGCSKSIGPLVGKNTVIYLAVWNPNPLQSSLLGDAHTSSSGPAIAGNISGKLLVESCSAGLSRSA